MFVFAQPSELDPLLSPDKEKRKKRETRVFGGGQSLGRGGGGGKPLTFNNGSTREI